MSSYCTYNIQSVLISIKYRDNQKLEIAQLKINYKNAEQAWNQEYLLNKSINQCLNLIGKPSIKSKINQFY